MTPLSSLIADSPIIFWQNIFFYLFILVTVLGIIFIYLLTKRLSKKTKENSQIQKQHIARLDKLREDHSIRVENLHTEMLKKEEERTRQWIESEKETLHVLNGVSSLLELSENIGRVESEKIINKLEEIKKIVTKKSDDHD